MIIFCFFCFDSVVCLVATVLFTARADLLRLVRFLDRCGALVDGFVMICVPRCRAIAGRCLMGPNVVVAPSVAWAARGR